MMRSKGFFIVFSLVLLVAAGASGGPLMPPLSTTPVAGESPLFDIGPSGGTGSITAYVDWMVLGAGDYTGTGVSGLVSGVFGSNVVPTGNWLYAYQVEANVTGTAIFTVDLVDFTSILFFGSLAGVDLDTVGHDAAVFANLGPVPPPAENEGYVCCQPNDDGVALSAGDISWKFIEPIPGVPGTGFVAGEESETLFFVATLPPVYNVGQVLDSGAAGFPGSGRVPSPAPEPASGLLLLLGIGSLAAYYRRRA
jgi:hypothetical protein